MQQIDELINYNAIKNISLCINALEEAKIVQEGKEDGNAEAEERTDD